MNSTESSLLNYFHIPSINNADSSKVPPFPILLLNGCEFTAEDAQKTEDCVFENASLVVMGFYSVWNDTTNKEFSRELSDSFRENMGMSMAECVGILLHVVSVKRQDLGCTPLNIILFIV